MHSLAVNGYQMSHLNSVSTNSAQSLWLKASVHEELAKILHGRKLFPLISFSIGVTEPDLEKCSSHNEVAELATDAKIQAKREIGNALFINRRRHI